MKHTYHLSNKIIHQSIISIFFILLYLFNSIFAVENNNVNDTFISIFNSNGSTKDDSTQNLSFLNEIWTNKQLKLGSFSFTTLKEKNIDYNKKISDDETNIPHNYYIFYLQNKNVIPLIPVMFKYNNKEYTLYINQKDQIPLQDIMLDYVYDLQLGPLLVNETNKVKIPVVAGTHIINIIDEMEIPENYHTTSDMSNYVYTIATLYENEIKRLMHNIKNLDQDYYENIKSYTNHTINAQVCMSNMNIISKTAFGIAGSIESNIRASNYCNNICTLFNQFWLSSI